MSRFKCFRKIDEMLSLSGANKKSGRNIIEEDLGLIKGGCIITEGDKICWVGKDKDLSAVKIKKLTGGKSIDEYFFKGYTIMPAFVECHTHTVFDGDRSDEFEMRNNGASYQEIATKGGGILSTVSSTRAASQRKLVGLAQKRVNEFIKQGVTALEIKSGYALDEKNEIKMLRVIRSLEKIKIVSTFLGAHALPKDMSQESYKSLLLEKLIPKVAQQKLADRVDIFLEQGYFDEDFAKLYLEKAAQYGLGRTIHLDQLSRSGAVVELLKLNLQSMDHLVAASSSDIKKIAKSNVTAVLLPGADFYLKSEYPKARELINEGARVALASDFNPGSCPTQDLSLIGLLARLEMKMSLPEVICAYTLGAAHALGLGEERGSIVKEKLCDFIVLDGSYRDLFYRCGHHPVSEVWSSAQKIYSHTKKT